jgi:HK97 gp10 family phage protein
MKIKLEGINQISQRLEALPQALQKAAEKAVLRAGAVPIRKAAKVHAKSSKDSGLLGKSIGLEVKKAKGITVARIGPRKGMRQKITRTDKRTGRKYEEMADPNNYSHLVEYGTSHSAAKPFIRPAIDSSKDQVVDAMAAGLDKHLTRVAARLRNSK